MSVTSACLKYLTTQPYSTLRLEEAIANFLHSAVPSSEIEMWGSVFKQAPSAYYTLLATSMDGHHILPSEHLTLPEDLVRARLSSNTVFEIETPASKAIGDMSAPRILIGVLTETGINETDRAEIESTLKKICSEHFRADIRYIYELLMHASQQSKDLTSFFHRIVQNILVPKFCATAASMFYHEAKTKSLILGNTTGIKRKEDLDMKRSDVRYFTDSKSYTAKCFESGEELLEHSFFDGVLPPNRLGESVVDIRSRINIPLRRWTRSRVGSPITSIGVLRIININSDSGHHPITSLEVARLRILCAGTSVLAERFVKTLSILHDQERATHGFNTDLAAIKYAAQNIERWLSRTEGNFSDDEKRTALQEVKYRVSDILAVQDNMASQILTVLFHGGNARWSPKKSESVLCSQPYKEIILRLMSASKGMSECFGRPELKITLEGKDRADDRSIHTLPSLNVPVGSLYIVFRNLAENAIKYSKKGTRPHLDISWNQTDRFIEFVFKDGGIGIPSEEQHLVFREGFRGRQAQEMQLRGNGLGLAVSLEVIRRHHGKLEYRAPEPGANGSTFALTVPIAH